MDKERKRQLQEQYKQMKPKMGVFMFRCDPTNQIYLGADQNLQGTLNSIQFQLKSGSYLTNRRLQKDWADCGAEAFTIETLELLEHDKEPTNPETDPLPRTDYSADLQVLKDAWYEKLTAQGFEVSDVNTRFKKK